MRSGTILQGTDETSVLGSTALSAAPMYPPMSHLSCPFLRPQRCKILSSASIFNLLTLSVVDLVQDLYLKELRNYKPQPLKPSDADAHVRKFSIPTAPPSPEESDIAKDLKAYEETPVEIEGALAPGEEPVDKFMQYLEDDLQFYEQDSEEEHH